MSTPSDPTIAGHADRSIAATQRLCGALSLGALKPKELKQLTTALMEASASEAAHNVAFRECILAIYAEVKASTASKPARSRVGTAKAKTPMAWLTPIHQVDPARFGPDKLLDPYLIQYAYGDENLRAILDGYSANRLKEAAAIVEERNPGTNPTSHGRKDALVEYIIRYVLR